MAIEDGAWIMRGLDWDDPSRIQTWEELIEWINEVGFLPLFKNEVDGFSAEENTSDLYWWSGDEEQDPWEWRQLIARSGKVAYGKFFGGKAGFISRTWFPHFANWRRDGYDFAAAGRTSWPLCVRSGSWTAFQSRTSGSPLSSSGGPASARAGRKTSRVR